MYNEFDIDQMELDPGAEAEFGSNAQPEGDQSEELSGTASGESSPEPDGFAMNDSTAEPGEKAEEGDEVGETESAAEESAPEKPRRGRRKKKETTEPEPEQPDGSDNQADVEGPDDGPDPDAEFYGEEEEGGNGEPDESPDDPDAARNVRRRRPRPEAEAMLDEYGRVVTERQSSARDGLKALTVARTRRIIQTGTVDGIENDGNVHPRVVFHVGGVKVLIPFSEMGFDLNPDEVDVSEAGRRIDAMLGAKIDYMVRHVDVANHLAAASRKDAMILRQRTILNARSRSGEDYRIREGMVHDIRDVVGVGEEVPVMITELRRDEETGEVVRMEVSMRDAEQTLETELRPGKSYTAMISGFSETAYFVKIVGVPVEVRCPINSSHVLETLDLGDKVKIVIRGISGRGGYFASIRKLIKKAEASLF